MTIEYKLSSDFPFAAGGEGRQYSHLGPNELHIKVEAETPKIAREVGQGIANAMTVGSCPAAQAAILHYIDQAKQKQMALVCTLTYSPNLQH